jgi:predicted short-subunit dehydrogenase-like oxidoreductase (DUF2520 family)
MITMDDPRLNAGYKLPDPVHPASLISAVEEVAARYPYAITADGLKGSIVARVAVELGCSWFEVGEAEDLTTDLNDHHTPGAPLCFTGRSLEYWSLLDDLSSQGWTWLTIARSLRHLHENYSTDQPPF